MSERAAPQMRIIPFTEHILEGRFNDRTIIVTGAASGIGRATALRLAKEGARVIATDVSGEGLQTLVAENPGLQIDTIVGNIANQEDVDKVIELAGPRLCGLVNNAGIMDGFQPIGEVTDQIWNRVFEVNVNGLMRMTRAALPIMLENGKGSIVNLTSAAGLGGGFAGAAYTASKHAVVGITKNTAIMYGADGIRCNAVAPGGVITNIGGAFQSERAQQRVGPTMFVSNPGMATPEALAAGIIFLISEDAANINGVVLNSDAGWRAS